MIAVKAERHSLRAARHEPNVKEQPDQRFASFYLSTWSLEPSAQESLAQMFLFRCMEHRVEHPTFSKTHITLQAGMVSSNAFGFYTIL